MAARAVAYGVGGLAVGIGGAAKFRQYQVQEMCKDMDPSLRPKADLPLCCVDVIVTCGRAMGVRQGIFADFTSEGIMARAREETGLNDFGDPTGEMVRALDKLCCCINNELRLSGMGRITGLAHLTRCAVNRLRLVQYFKDHPEIADQRVKAPVVITGLPHSGASFIRSVLSCDPRFRTPLMWEMLQGPAPHSGGDSSDPRVELVTRELETIPQYINDLHTIHPMKAHSPEECLLLFQMDFKSMAYAACFGVTDYEKWLIHLPSHEQVTALNVAKLSYQALQFQSKEHKTWLLKSPGYLCLLKEFTTLYPDAKVIVTHRPPSEVMGLWCSFSAKFKGLYTFDIHPTRIGKDWVECWGDIMENHRVDRKILRIKKTPVVDVMHKDLMADPMAVIKNIYREFKWNLPADVEDRMRERIAEESRARPVVAPQLKWFGLVAEQVDSDIADDFMDP